MRFKNILIAPNAFKGSLSAKEAAKVIALGLKKGNSDLNLELFPVADGGDGTEELLTEYGKGERIPAEVQNAFDEKIQTSFGWLPAQKIAIIGISAASGIAATPKSKLNPLNANTFGTGEMIVKAMELKPETIILTLGGSVTIDGGTGILQAVGTRFFGKDGKELTNLPEDLIYLDSVDFPKEKFKRTSFILLCDVENPLLGVNGAVRTFGVQKGAKKKDFELLENRLENWADCIYKTTGKEVKTLKYGGAAGGISTGLYGILDAELKSGADYFLDRTGFDEKLQTCEVLIAGEGKIDEQTKYGKAPFEVARRAKKAGKYVFGLTGKNELKEDSVLWKYFDEIIEISPEGTSLETAIENTAVNLKKSAEILGKGFMKS